MKCNLCGWILPEDDLLKVRRERHESFHTPTSIKRNTKMGTVEWK